MEPSYQTRKLIGRLLLLVMLALVGVAFCAQYTSKIVQTLAARTQGPVQIAVFTDPAMRFAYNPVTRKTVVTVAPCSIKKKETCFNGEYDRFFVPQETDQDVFWAQFKENLVSWRFNLTPLWNYMREYVNALVQKRTNLNPAEWVALSLELPYLTATDFAVEQPVTVKKKGKHAPKEEPVSKPEFNLSPRQMADKHLVVEILNASGKRGIAAELKQYLREQSNKGLLLVDVIDTGNYPSLQDTSFIIDYSGKLVQVTQISRAIGLNGEIRSEKSSTTICDSRIVLGKDFQMPL